MHATLVSRFSGDLTRKVMASKTAPSVSDCEKTTMSPFVKRIYDSLCNKFSLHREDIPEVSVGPFNKGEELFGSKRDKKVMLLDRKEPSKIKLLQFDPNFFSSQVVCRFNGCSKVQKEKAQGPKRDLFLCTEHYKQLKLICGQPRYKTEKSYKMSTEIQNRSWREDYSGYINITGVLDAAYFKLKTDQSHNKEGVPKSKTRKVAQTSCQLRPQEVLDFRNLLVLTNVLLNPSSAEVILEQILPFLSEWASEGEVSEAEVRFALTLGFTILDCFNITYQNLPETGDNPGKIIGWGTGGLTGLTGFYFLVPYFNSPELLALPPRELVRVLAVYVSAHCVCSLSVAYFFGCIASGVYRWYGDWRRRQELYERVHTNLSGIYRASSTQDQNLALDFVAQHGGEIEDDDEGYNDEDDDRE